MAWPAGVSGDRESYDASPKALQLQVFPSCDKLSVSPPLNSEPSQDRRESPELEPRQPSPPGPTACLPSGPGPPLQGTQALGVLQLPQWHSRVGRGQGLSPGQRGERSILPIGNRTQPYRQHPLLLRKLAGWKSLSSSLSLTHHVISSQTLLRPVPRVSHLITVK